MHPRLPHQLHHTFLLLLAWLLNFVSLQICAFALACVNPSIKGMEQRL